MDLIHIITYIHYYQLLGQEGREEKRGVGGGIKKMSTLGIEPQTCKFIYIYIYIYGYDNLPNGYKDLVENWPI